MTQNNNINVLAWYSDVSYQNHRKDYAFGEVFPLVCPVKKALPFQIVRETRANAITKCELFNINDTLAEDVTTTMLANGLSIVRYEALGYDVVVYHGIQNLSSTIGIGQYYLKITDGVDTWYSEVFCMIDNISLYTMIEYWNATNIDYTGGCIDYSTPYFRNLMYVPTQISRPEYPVEEEATKRDGYTFIAKQLSSKLYKFNMLAPEYLCDAMRLMPLHDYVRITSNGTVYHAETFNVNPVWQDGGYIAAVECEFETDTIIKKISYDNAPDTEIDFTNPNNNLSPLPFYSSLDFQSHRKDYAFGEVFPLITPEKMLLPFQVIREHRANAISEFKLYKEDGTFFLDITSSITSIGLSIIPYTADGYDVILYNGLLPMAITTPEGRYYAVMKDGVDTWYSEIFTIVKSVSDYLCIEYWNADNLYYAGGHLDYTTNFRNKLYLRAQLWKPEYLFEEEAVKRDGYTYIAKQISEKIYKFNFIAPEYLCDAIRVAKLHDYIRITSKGVTYNAETLTMTPTWQEGGYLANVEVEFETDTVIKKVSKDTLGDFNYDFNEDFNNGS